MKILWNKKKKNQFFFSYQPKETNFISKIMGVFNKKKNLSQTIPSFSGSFLVLVCVYNFIPINATTFVCDTYILKNTHHPYSCE